MQPQQSSKQDVESAARDEDEAMPLLSGKEGSTSDRTGSHPGDVGSITSLSRQFGSKLLIMLSISQHLMKGFANSFTYPAQQFLYGSYHVSGPQMQIFIGVTQLPWALKPIIGLASDIMPVMGFHKMPYMFIATVFGLAGCASVGLVPQEQLGVTQMTLCLFMMVCMFSTVDLLTEAKYAERMRSKPEYGPALMSYVWGGLTLGSLAATVLIGPVISHWNAKVPFVLALLPISLIFFPLMGNYLEEKVVNDEDLDEARRNIMRQRAACGLCFLMFVATMCLSFLGIFSGSMRMNALAALIVALVILFIFSVALRPIIAKVNAFLIISRSMNLSISGATFYFYTNSPEAYPEGPHFSTEFYTTGLGVVGSVCSLIGIWSYQRYASTWTYRRLLISINIVLSVLYMFDTIFFARLNVRVGIPDHIFVIGTEAFEDAIFQWMWMPQVVLLSQLCPDGMEAIMYALLAGCTNLGNSIASSWGAAVLEWFGVEPNGSPGESAQFENLWKVSALSILLPLITVALVPWLIPDAKQTDKLLADGDRDATTGSLLRRWLGEDEDE